MKQASEDSQGFGERIEVYVSGKDDKKGIYSREDDGKEGNFKK